MFRINLAVFTPPQQSKSTTRTSKNTSRQDAEKAKAEKEAALGQLMDDMETSVEAQGQYFVKIGQKKPITKTREKSGGLFRKPTSYEETVGYEDSRALILRPPVSHEWGGVQFEHFVIVTPDGFWVIRFSKRDIENPQDSSAKYEKNDYDFLVALTKGEEIPGSYSKFTRSGRTWYKVGLEFKDSENASPLNLRLAQAPPDILNIFQESISKSVAMSESPHKQRVEEATQQKQSALDAAQVIKSLPPRE